MRTSIDVLCFRREFSQSEFNPQRGAICIWSLRNTLPVPGAAGIFSRWCRLLHRPSSPRNRTASSRTVILLLSA